MYPSSLKFRTNLSFLMIRGNLFVQTIRTIQYYPMIP
jgi:hypothetical protein